MELHGLPFPTDLFYAPDHNLWLREEADGSLTLGLTAYGCALYGQIFAFTPKRDGLHIERDRSFGVVEFAKAASSARSPLSGTLLASNPRGGPPSRPDQPGLLRPRLAGTADARRPGADPGQAAQRRGRAPGLRRAHAAGALRSTGGWSSGARGLTGRGMAEGSESRTHPGTDAVPHRV